ncbi:MAG: DJ-1/PfpI family protein [Sphingomonadales bacterium]|nr:DJ-1/PfpI family protein [Sphingomonadales bacterium]
MARILVLLPQAGFDPTEVAVPWRVWDRAGHEVLFATETGEPAKADVITLSGEGLPWYARSLAARHEGRRTYAIAREAPSFRAPLRWDAVNVAEFDALHFPGGHAPGMRGFLESPVVADIARAAFAAQMPVSAICHGVLALARAGVLEGRRTTALTSRMEGISVALTRWALPGHYRTYPQSVEREVRRALGRKGQFLRGPLLPKYANRDRPEAGFVVQDGNYVSARWPGDAWTLALRLMDLL